MNLPQFLTTPIHASFSSPLTGRLHSLLEKPTESRAQSGGPLLWFSSSHLWFKVPFLGPKGVGSPRAEVTSGYEAVQHGQSPPVLSLTLSRDCIPSPDSDISPSGFTRILCGYFCNGITLLSVLLSSLYPSKTEIGRDAHSTFYIPSSGHCLPPHCPIYRRYTRFKIDLIHEY